MKTILALLFFSISLLGYSQLEGLSPNTRYRAPIQTPNNVERYGIDYELKDYIFSEADSTFINQIDLNALDHLRAQDSDIEVTDPGTGLIVILYYEKRKPIGNTLLINE
ncbi:MAG: hypothetical protein ACJA1C_000858 [Crocinitomicaceae bacterium]|jgi:hypothetical protein